MSKIFKFKRKYYEERMIYKKGSVTIEPGVTVLVGCNGSGKSTLQIIMKNQLKHDNIQFISYDNEKDGGYQSRQYEMEFGDPLKSFNMCMSSEGENILINLSRIATDIGKYVRTGKHETILSKFDDIFNTGPKEDNTGNQRWIFFDAVDSGYSIDNVVEFKELLHLIVSDCNDYNLEPYIIVSANSYEMCADMPCLSVIDCAYTEFQDYQSYRDFILKTRKFKDREQARL